MKNHSIVGSSASEFSGVASPRTNHSPNWRRFGPSWSNRIWWVIARPFHKSIYVRFQYAFGLAIVGYLVMAVITIVSKRALLSTYENSVAEARFELMPLHHLQVSLRKLDHLIQRYALGSDQSAPIHFKALQDVIDREFGQLARIEQQFASVEHPHSHISIPSLVVSWKNAQGEVLRVFAHTAGTPEAVEALKRASMTIDPIYDVIAEFEHHSMRDVEETLKQAHADVGLTYFAMLGAILAGFCVLIFMGLAVGRSILQPITELRRAAYKLSKRDFSHRVRLRNNMDELGQLGRAFNIAARVLQHLYEDLERRSTYDGLTGVLNRAAFDARLSAECNAPIVTSGRCPS